MIKVPEASIIQILQFPSESLKAAKPVGTSLNFRPKDGDRSPGQR